MEREQSVQDPPAQILDSPGTLEDETPDAGGERIFKWTFAFLIGILDASRKRKVAFRKELVPYLRQVGSESVTNRSATCQM